MRSRFLVTGLAASAVQLPRMVMTAVCGAGFTLILWVMLMMLFDRRFRGYDDIVWSGTLWLSAMLCTGVVAYSRRSVRPVLSCTIAFGIFGLTYMACEGPIFGVVSEGGDPSMTQFVVFNLTCLPVGVFAATELGSWLGRRHRVKSADENQPLSHTRLLLLFTLLIVELAVTLSLRTSGWSGTGRGIRACIIVIAASMPFIMTAVFLYQTRVRFRHGQFNLRTLMAFTFVVASYLALIPLFARPKEPNFGPLPISGSVTFEVYQEVPAGTSNGMMFMNPDSSGNPLTVVGPPIITSSDVLTITLVAPATNEGFTSLDISLNPAGANKLFNATAAANGSTLVVIVDGEVVTAPNIYGPVGHQFRLVGGRIHTDGIDLFKTLTRE